MRLDAHISISDGNNVYALNVKQNVIHVSEAESGRKGYFCLGCTGELQAVISTKENRISYFRHDPTNVEYKTKCTYSDETHRHKLAKEILLRIKKIKVPSIYKYPPKGEDGLANLLHDAKIVEADSVGIERCFYENEEGEILQGRSGDADDKYLLIQPDVTFFDRSGNPVLFIELVATHKVNAEKLTKIKRLGIDTIEVIIPKSSPQEIEDTFFKSTNTKWIYNGKEERTQYLRVSNPNTEGISSVDELQRRLFEETYECRATQISNLIRAIKKCLGAKPYADIERGFREEISRVERNTERDRERLQGIQENIQREISNEFGDRIADNSEKRRRLSSEENKLRKSVEDLEDRYKSKRGELEKKSGDFGGEEKLLDLAISGEIENLRGEGKSIEERGREIDRNAKSVRENIDEAERQIGRTQEDLDGLPEEFERLTEEAIRKFESDKADEESKIGDIEKRTEKLRELLERDRKGLEERNAEIRDNVTNAIEGKGDFGNIDLLPELKRLLRTRELLLNIPNVREDYQRHRKAWECFGSGAYKNWKK
jgi:hypothetical protein